MSFGRTKSVIVSGIAGTVIDVEANLAPGLPKVTISGMPDAAINQSPDRLRAAMGQSDLGFPDSRLTINLSPASVRKHGAGLDLAMAVAILATGAVLDNAETARIVHLGELGMDGRVKAVRGILPAVLAALRDGIDEVVVPAANANEAALVNGVRVHPVKTLSDVVAFHRCRAAGSAFELPWPTRADDAPEETSEWPIDMADIVGQYEARQALEVAAAGGHNLAMVGPPGAGKTMLASRLPTILPPLDVEDALDVTSVRSVVGQVSGPSLIEQPPFVAPHHSATMAAMIGGGSGRVRPGAASLAHAGVLFLDEAPEFSPAVLDALRQPLECGLVTIARSEEIVRYPCRFQLVLASNPCPCGRYSGNGAACTCSTQARLRYGKRLSGPLLDRIDVHLHIPAVTRADLGAQAGESSAEISERVRLVRERSAYRWREAGFRTNAHVPGAVLRSSRWRLPSQTTSVLDQALDRGVLSLRGYDRTLRLAWTLADIREHSQPDLDDVYAALTLRDSEAAA